MELEKDKLYICFHRPSGIVGGLIALWTLGKYAHSEFIYNDKVYLSNPGGIRVKDFKYKRYMDIYELDSSILSADILEFFGSKEGKGYDYLGILGQFFYANNVQNDDKYFCSEFCLNAIDYALQFSLTYKYRSLKDREGYDFSPNKLYRYLRDMELIKEKI